VSDKLPACEAHTCTHLSNSGSPGATPTQNFTVRVIVKIMIYSFHI